MAGGIIFIYFLPILQEAAERRQRQAGGLPNILEIEGVARPNPRPQQEISISQQGSRRIAPVNNRGAIPLANPRRSNGRPPRSRFNVRRMFEDRGVHNESDIEVSGVINWLSNNFILSHTHTILVYDTLINILI